MDETPALLLAGVLTFVFGWNNSSILIGNERGSGTLSARESVVLCSLGMLLGVALEGSKMKGSLGAIVSGTVSDPVVLGTLAVSIFLTFGLTLFAIPVSFSNTMVGAFVGGAVAESLGIQVGHVETIVEFWVVAPIATMALAVVAIRLIESVGSRLSLLDVDALNRAGVGLVSFALAYVLSANNIGLFYGTAVGTTPAASSGSSLSFAVALGLTAIVAMSLFGRGAVAGTVGDRLLSLSPQGVLAAFSATILVMWLATQLVIPISVSQCLIGGMFGAALTKRIAIVNRRVTIEVLSSWVLVPLVALVLAYLLVPLM